MDIPIHTGNESPNSTTVEAPGRRRANSTISDVVMSDPLDTADSPTTDPSAYSDSATQEGTSELAASEPKELGKAVSSSPFFKLPRELRAKIYALCLTTKYSILWPIDRLQLEMSPQLLRVCKDIAREAAPVLYTNMLHFLHPSDANMFLWAHGKPLAQGSSKMLLQIRDRDVNNIWTSYLGSSLLERSIQHDYPNLRTLHIQLRSNFLHAMNGHLAERFEHWEADSALRELALSLEGRVPQKCDVRVLVCSRLVADDVRALLQHFPDDLERVNSPGSGGGGRIVVRTAWKSVFRALAALEIEGQEQMRFFGP